MNQSDTITRRLYQIAGPIILANLATPLLGMVDTAVIGQQQQPFRVKVKPPDAHYTRHVFGQAII